MRAEDIRYKARRGCVLGEEGTQFARAVGHIKIEELHLITTEQILSAPEWPGKRYIDGLYSLPYAQVVPSPQQELHINSHQAIPDG